MMRRAATIVITASCLALLLAVSGCEEDADGLGNPQIHAQKEQSWAFDVSLPVLLDVESSNGEIVVIGVEEGTVLEATATCRTRGRTEEEAAERLGRLVCTAEQVGDRVELRYRGAEQDDDVRRFSGVDFRVATPPEGRLLLRTANGDIVVEGTHGNVTASTSNGAIDVMDVEGSIFASSSNGRLHIVRITGDVRGRTSNGEAWLEDVIGAVDVESSNGGLYYLGRPVGIANRLDTSNGSITVRIPNDAHVALDASTSRGSIRTSLPLLGDLEGLAWQAELNPPVDAAMSLHTSNGSIRIDGL